MKRIDIFLIHGISKGSIPNGYYDEFVNGIRKNLPIDLDINFHPIDYSFLLEKEEANIYEEQKPYHFYKKLLGLATELICDVLAYAPTEKVEGFYNQVHELIDRKYDSIEMYYPFSIKVFMCHSLGSQIGTTYLWRKNVDHIITMGCPVRFFSIRFKEKPTPPNVLTFTNFYSRYDPVSTALKPMWNFVKDVCVDSWFTPLNKLPMKAHSSYWTSSIVQKRLRKF